MLLAQDIVVEYNLGTDKPVYDLIIGKQTMHGLRVVLDFKESTYIYKILLPMRDINASFAQEPVSTSSTTKRVEEILDAIDEKSRYSSQS